MPYFKVTTDKSITEEQKNETLKAMHQLVADELGKPDRFIMTGLQDQVALHFGVADTPAAFVEFKSIGLPDTKKLSAAICDMIDEKLEIAPDRVYIEFCDEPRNLFGHNRTTFV